MNHTDQADRIPSAISARDGRTIILAAFLGLFLSGYNNFIAAIALIEIKPQLHLNSVSIGLILAATFMGMLIGAPTLGHLADKVGRRPAMIVNMSLITFFAVLSGFISNAPELVLMRLLMGIGIGAGYPIGASYVADISSAHHRGANMTLAFCGWGFGAFACGLAGWWCVALFPASIGWRFMLASGAIPAIAALAIIILRKLPESHAWKHGKTLPPLPYTALGRPENRRRTIAVLLPWFLMDLPVYGIGLLLPTLLTQLHIGGRSTVVISTCALSAFTLLGFGVAYWTIDRLGRRKLQITGFLLMALLFAALAIGGTGIAVLWLLILFAAIQICINAGPNTTTWIVAAEVFPARLRARGQGLATGFSRIGAASGAFFLPVIDARSGPAAAFALVAGASVLGAIITWVYLPETARKELAH